MSSSDTLPVWEKFYQIVSRSNEHVTDEVIDETLDICQKKIVNVLLDYKPYTKESFEKWKKEITIGDDEMSYFINRMSKELDLDVTIAWSVICNYLIFRYYGKVDELKSIIRYEANVKSFIDHIWYFYTSDRMFLLKTLRFIFEKLSEREHVFFEKYNNFISTIDVMQLWKNLGSTFENLLKEVDREKSNRVSSDILTKWVQRNNREQSEVLILMIHALNVLPLDGEELVYTLTLFMRHGFGRHSLFYGAESLSRSKDLIDIQNAEIGVIMIIIQRYWGIQKYQKPLPKQVESDLEQYQMQSDNSVILLLWVVFKASLSDDHLEYCTNALEALMERKVFKSLSTFLTLDIFQNCTVYEIVIEAVHKFFWELIRLCTDYRYIYEQEGVVNILCELFKKPHLDPLEIYSPFFEIAVDMFPFILNNFLNMAKSLATSEKYYFKVLKLLRNFPSYCTELLWPYISDAVYSDEEKDLFLGTDRFKIPKGTLTERCNCYGVDMLKFYYKYNYFQVIEQYMRSLTMWVINTGEYNKFILNCVLKAYTFLSFLIKHYRGNFCDDQDIRPLLKRLDCVPTYYNKGGFRSYEFFYVFFEVKCSLFIHHNVNFQEAFPLIVRKSMFPSITDYNLSQSDLKIMHTSEDSILYSFLREEERKRDHKLLLKYTEIVLAVLKQKIMYKEVLYGALWYVLNVVFLTHQQWNYDEAEQFQQVKILNTCTKIFITVLQENYEDLRNQDEKALFHLVRDSFLNNECVISSLCSVFVKDKFYLQNLMHQESNWIAGSSLVVIDTVKAELILLHLIFKCRIKMSDVPHCIIDGKTHTLAKSASLYFVNPYNCTLVVLAGKFLDVLAMNDNIPLMSSLGLDLDQIQTLFLERLRDPMEDDDVKINILDLISTCILHQTGMTAAFFNITAAKKWYDNESKSKNIERDTVPNFMIDYLDNIEKSVAYLKSPLQVGILRVMAILWQSQKQHLVKEVTELPHFWSLLCAPLYKNFEQAPLVYYYIIKILSIQLMNKSARDGKEELFYKALEKFFLNQRQLRLFQQYLYKMFSKQDMEKEHLEFRRMLIEAWAELLVNVEKHKKISHFPSSECRYFFVELCLDGVRNNLIHENILSTWLEFVLVIVDMFGLKFEQRYEEISEKSINFAKIINIYYENMSVKDKVVSLTIILRIIKELKARYDANPDELAKLLDEIGPLMDTEHTLLEEKILTMLKECHPSAAATIAPWAMFISIANYILTLDNCDYFTVWFSNRKYLDKMIKCTCDLLTYKESLSAGKVALYSLTLYVQSSLAYDFLKVNMLQFYDKVEPMVNKLLTGQFSKVNVLDLKEAWLLFTLLIKFNQAFIKKFRKSALDICYAFLTLNEHIIKHIINIPQNTVDTNALDLLMQTLVFYDEILEHWNIEWYRKSNKTYSLMIDGIRRVINCCIYLCLRPKHIVYYFLDNYYRLLPLDKMEESNELMIVSMNRLIGILGLSFNCLYKLNISLLEMFDFLEPEESITILIENDFSVPRFELPIPCELTYGKLLCLAHFLCKTINQLKEKRPKKMIQVKEEKYKYYIGLVEHQDPSENIPNEKLSSFLRYLAEDSGLVDPWINHLHPDNVQKTADVLMLFTAQQTFLTLRVLEPHQIMYYKRNLSSELQFFNEFVKKQTSELLDSSKLTSKSQVSPYKADMDIIKRYLLYHWEHKKQNDICNQNFLLIISYWFSNICQIQ